MKLPESQVLLLGAILLAVLGLYWLPTTSGEKLLTLVVGGLLAAYSKPQ